jgi:Entner-Doudoroff aldolase
MGEARASAILRTSDEAAARAAMEAAVRGGFRVIEFTLGIPNALGLVREFRQQPDLVVGVGTVLTVEDAEAAVAAGAEYIVSPVVDEAVIAACHRLGVAAMPGTYSPTDMYRAHVAGAQLVKLFPVPVNGPTYVRQVLGPLPFLRIVPTTGADADNAAALLAAGAFAVGFTATLFQPSDVQSGRVDRLEDRARQLLSLCATPRPSPASKP